MINVMYLFKKKAMRKILLLIGIILLLSCEKQNDCKICKIKLFVPGQEVVITVDTVCYDIQEGFFYSIDSIGRVGLKTVGCEKY